jgi:ATP-dependent Clp protease, protease subunit
MCNVMVALHEDLSFADRLLQSRIVFLGQEVNDEIANKVCAQLLYLEGENDQADIWLYINSPGGSVTAGMAIYDTMQFVGCDVATVALGFAASMGQFLLCAGAPGKRFALPNARVLMHQPSAGLQGVATDIAIQAQAFGHTKVVLAERIAEHTGQSVEQIRADWDRDRWFTAEESRDYGFVDRILTSRRDLPRSAVDSHHTVEA